MRKASILILILFAMPSVPLQARLLARLDSQLEDKVLRILIEGDPAIVGVAIETLQASGFERGIRIVVVAERSQFCDARVIITAGAGQTWDTNPTLPTSTPQFPVSFGFGTAVGPYA